LLEPLAGEIVGLQTTQVEIIYTPSTFTTAEAVIKIRTTEFDSEQHTIRIVGSSQPVKLNVRTGQVELDEQPEAPTEAESEAEEYEVRKTKTRTLLTNKKEARPSSKGGQVRLEKIPEKTMMKASALKGSLQEGTTEVGLIPQTKTIKLTVRNIPH